MRKLIAFDDAFDKLKQFGPRQDGYAPATGRRRFADLLKKHGAPRLKGRI